jgi:uncharacterized membrane protein SpoIIM required for sporulation
MAAAGTAELAFSTQRFREERAADWEEFDRLLTRLERGSAANLDDDELLRLPVLYRATLSSLSIARATTLDRQMLDYLESLSMRGYFMLYGVRTSRRGKLASFFLEDWPNAVRALWKETFVAALIMTLAAVAAHMLVTNDPQWFYQFLDGGLAAGREPGADKQFLRDTLFDTSDEEKSGLYIFATFLFTHNSQVSITAFALGFAFGLPTLFLIFYNGLSLGAMTAVFAEAGLSVEFAAWLSIHGTTELFAIVLAGAAGLKIGTAVIFPGKTDRLTAAANAGKTSAKVMVGVILMLLCAGLLEGFGRQLINSTFWRFAVGGLMLALWISYYYIIPALRDWQSYGGQTESRGLA